MWELTWIGILLPSVDHRFPIPLAVGCCCLVHRAAVLEGFLQYYWSTLSFELSLHTYSTKRIYLHTLVLSLREDYYRLACWTRLRLMFGGGVRVWFSVALAQSLEGYGHLDLRDFKHSLSPLYDSQTHLLFAVGIGQEFPAPLPAVRHLYLELIYGLRQRAFSSSPGYSFSQPPFILSGALWILAPSSFSCLSLLLH